MKSNKAWDEMSRRNEQILDALQTARFILAGPSVGTDPTVQAARAKVAVDEARVVVEAALKLLEPLRS